MTRALANLALLAATVTVTAAVQAQTLRVLVTNDDGIAAPGIAAVVDQLALNPNLQINIVAPATNQSGTGDTVTTSKLLSASPGATASGVPGIALEGYPADTVYFGLRQALPEPPDLVVSGINAGQNIGREIVEISGTVGAALTAGRLGIPAIAVSQGVGTNIDYSAAARYTANVVEQMRIRPRLWTRITRVFPSGQKVVLNVNFPTCTTGDVRGVAVVPLAQIGTVKAYELQSEEGTTQTFRPVIQISNPLLSDCTSELVEPANDVEAMNDGFASVTPLNPDMTVGSRLNRYRFLSEIPF
jgi:5'/3'-nucleotidase